jgi:hypothetical protein
MDTAQGFVARNRTRQGPYSSTALRQKAVAGTLQPDDMVLACGATKWQLASTVPGLFPPLPTPAPTPAADEPPPKSGPAPLSGRLSRAWWGRSSL